ncbi:MAG: sigma-70 family RNA polymerase sigma factor [Candidatus Paceibacterota bacterium]
MGRRRKNNPERIAEEGLILRCQRGDEDAFAELVERYSSKVTATVRGIIRRSNDVEDLVQQVFTKACLSIKRFRLDSSFATWIHRITVNECYDHLRKKKVRKLTYECDLAEDDARTVDCFPDSSPSVDARMRNHRYVARLLSRVSAEDRGLLIQKEVEGFSIEELSGMTGLKENTIKVRLFRARQKMIKAAAGRNVYTGCLAACA